MSLIFSEKLFKSPNLQNWIIVELINLLQSFKNSRKKDSLPSLFVNADPG